MTASQWREGGRGRGKGDEREPAGGVPASQVREACGAGRRCSSLVSRWLSGGATLGAGWQEVVREVEGGNVLPQGQSLLTGVLMGWPRSPKPIRGSSGGLECHSSV